MQTVYRTSVLSPRQVAGYKLSNNHDPDLNVFSQRPTIDMEYMEDSFCVGDDVMEDGNNKFLYIHLIDLCFVSSNALFKNKFKNK